MDNDMLRRCPLFSGMTDGELKASLKFYNAAEQSYRRGAVLVGEGDPMTRFGLVLEGRVQVFMDDIHGDRIIMANVAEGNTFGESLCFLQTRYAGIYVAAATDCRVLWLRCDGLRARDDCEVSHMNSLRFTAMLASRTLNMNDRIQILSKRTLRKKLCTYFSQCRKRYRDTEFDVDLDRADMAAYLGADRSALSRELSAMRRDGEIDFKKHRFRILNVTEEC